MSRRDYETTRALTRRSESSRRPDEQPFLMAIAGEHAGRFVPLEGRTELLIGRTPDCDFRIQHDGNISRRHARITIDADGQVHVEDLESTNGTLLNGREIASAMLHRGDRLFLGLSTILKFDYLSEAERASWESATFDALTECHNRAFFDARLVELAALARQNGQPLSLVLLDVDHFKRINDTHGHQAGDYALQRVAQAIQAELMRRGGDGFACRYGGEEFVILLPGCSPQGAGDFAEGMRRAVEKLQLEFEGEAFHLTLSAGHATADPPGPPRGDLSDEDLGTRVAAENPDDDDLPPIDPVDLVRRADAALYRAKRSGRNRVEEG